MKSKQVMKLKNKTHKAQQKMQKSHHADAQKTLQTMDNTATIDKRLAYNNPAFLEHTTPRMKA